MNSKSISIVGLLSITICSVAVAGPDWEIIHKAEADRASSEHSFINNNMKKKIIFLNHGPRAITTLYTNEERKLKQMSSPQNSDSTTGVGLAQPDPH